MKKRGKLITTKITLVAPSTSRRFQCVGYRPDLDRYAWHRLKDGDTLHMCQYSYCQASMCQDHIEMHHQEHELKRLGA